MRPTAASGGGGTDRAALPLGGLPVQRPAIVYEHDRIRAGKPFDVREIAQREFEAVHAIDECHVHAFAAELGDHVDLGGLYKVSEQDLLAYIDENVTKVNGDFRQEEIMRTWRRHLKAGGKRTFPCATVKIECSSGTYVRSIAHGLGQHLSTPALALHILRTKVGDYSVERSIK